MLRRLHPATWVIATFSLAIAVGSGLLMLPAATVDGRISAIDALFTATSAVCVTGLTVLDTGSSFTRFGQVVILLLIQVGGLGVMTLAVLIFQVLGRSLSFRHKMAVQDVFSHAPRADIHNLLKMIVLFTGAVELAGAAALFLHWRGDEQVRSPLFQALFHSVSAFCNAGFSLFSDSLVAFRTDPFIVFVVSGLIILGGIGFPVVHEILARVTDRGGRRHPLSVQTRTVLLVSLLLIAAGMFVFWEVEMSRAFRDYSIREMALTSFFQSVTCRTAGFNTIDITLLSERSLAFMLFLMFFGASPGSCGGGVKTTTLAVIGTFAWSRARRKYRVNMFRRSLPAETVNRAMSLILLATAFIAVVLYLLLLSNEGDAGRWVSAHRSFLPLLFETVSAFGTVGLSLGVAPGLNVFGKLLIVATMLVGRVGVLTFAYIIAGPVADRGLEYAEEDLMVG